MTAEQIITDALITPNLPPPREPEAPTPAPAPEPMPALTARELEVWALVADGLTNSEIATRLSISVKTVEAHRGRVFKKLGAANVAQAITISFRRGWLK